MMVKGFSVFLMENRRASGLTTPSAALTSLWSARRRLCARYSQSDSMDGRTERLVTTFFGFSDSMTARTPPTTGCRATECRW